MENNRITTSRTLPTKLTPIEIDERALALAQSVAEHTRIKRAAKIAAADWKEQIDDEEEKIQKLSRAANTGVEDREVECEIRITGNVAEIVRLDTLEVVDVRPATKQELRDRYVQTTIFDHGAGESEPEEEPSSATDDATGINESPLDLNDLGEVPLRVSARMFQDAVMSPELSAVGVGMILRYGGSQYVVWKVDTQKLLVQALRVKLADGHEGERLQYSAYGKSYVGMEIIDCEGVAYVIVADTIYNVLESEIPAEEEVDKPSSSSSRSRQKAA